MLAAMMQKLTLPPLLGALTIFYVASCGGKVVFDSGTGGMGQGGSGTSTSSSSVSSTSVSSSSSGEPSPCDGTASCEKCVNCTVGVVCAEQWEKCASVAPCMELVYCLASCHDAQGCIDKCLDAFPEGIDVYNETANCVICQACFNDCNGLAKGCM